MFIVYFINIIYVYIITVIWHKYSIILYNIMWGHIILIKGNIIYVTYSNKLLCHIYIINLYKLYNNDYNKLYLL